MTSKRVLKNARRCAFKLKQIGRQRSMDTETVEAVTHALDDAVAASTPIRANSRSRSPSPPMSSGSESSLSSDSETEEDRLRRKRRERKRRRRRERERERERRRRKARKRNTVRAFQGLHGNTGEWRWFFGQVDMLSLECAV